MLLQVADADLLALLSCLDAAGAKAPCWTGTWTSGVEVQRIVWKHHKFYKHQQETVEASKKNVAYFLGRMLIRNVFLMLGLRPYTLLGGEQEEGMTEGRKEGMKDGREERSRKQAKKGGTQHDQ